VTLAAELNIGTVNLSFVTDADAGLEPAAGAAAGGSAGDSVSAELVFRRLSDAQPRIVAAIETIVRAIPESYQPRELIPEAAVRAVLERAVLA
jgi:5'-methylthioadenosine phosphorylase